MLSSKEYLYVYITHFKCGVHNPLQKDSQIRKLDWNLGNSVTGLISNPNQTILSLFPHLINKINITSPLCGFQEN